VKLCINYKMINCLAYYMTVKGEWNVI